MDKNLIRYTKMNAQITHRDAVLHEDIRIHDGDQLMQEVRLRVKQLWSQLFHNGLQLLCCRGRHSIPGLRFPPGEQTDKLTLNTPERHTTGTAKNFTILIVRL